MNIEIFPQDILKIILSFSDNLNWLFVSRIFSKIFQNDTFYKKRKAIYVIMILSSSLHPQFGSRIKLGNLVIFHDYRSKLEWSLEVQEIMIISNFQMIKIKPSVNISITEQDLINKISNIPEDSIIKIEHEFKENIWEFPFDNSLSEKFGKITDESHNGGKSLITNLNSVIFCLDDMEFSKIIMDSIKKRKLCIGEQKQKFKKFKEDYNKTSNCIIL